MMLLLLLLGLIGMRPSSRSSVGYKLTCRWYGWKHPGTPLPTTAKVLGGVALPALFYCTSCSPLLPSETDWGLTDSGNVGW